MKTVLIGVICGVLLAPAAFLCLFLDTLTRVTAQLPITINQAIAREATLTRASVESQITPVAAKLDSQVTNLQDNLFARADKIEVDANDQLTGIRVDAVELANQIALVRDPVLELLPPVKNTLDKVSYTGDLMLDCDHNPDCFANRSQGALKSVEKMANAGENTMKVIADTARETTAAIKSTSKDMATIVHEITKPTTWIKKAAGTAASIIGKFFGM